MLDLGFCFCRGGGSSFRSIAPSSLLQWGGWNGTCFECSVTTTTTTASTTTSTFQATAASIAKVHRSTTVDAAIPNQSLEGSNPAPLPNLPTTRTNGWSRHHPRTSPSHPRRRRRPSMSRNLLLVHTPTQNTIHVHCCDGVTLSTPTVLGMDHPSSWNRINSCSLPSPK